jgi:hypothetical protein
MTEQELDIGIRNHQELEESWVHYSKFTTTQANHRTDDPEKVTCPSCRRALKVK